MFMGFRMVVLYNFDFLYNDVTVLIYLIIQISLCGVLRYSLYSRLAASISSHICRFLYVLKYFLISLLVKFRVWHSGWSLWIILIFSFVLSSQVLVWLRCCLSLSYTVSLVFRNFSFWHNYFECELCIFFLTLAIFSTFLVRSLSTLIEKSYRTNIFRFFYT